jgi:hypothetical protein
MLAYYWSEKYYKILLINIINNIYIYINNFTYLILFFIILIVFMDYCIKIIVNVIKVNCDFDKSLIITILILNNHIIINVIHYISVIIALTIIIFIKYFLITL